MIHMSAILLLFFIVPALSSAPGPFRPLIDSIRLKGSPPGTFQSPSPRGPPAPVPVPTTRTTTTRATTTRATTKITTIRPTPPSPRPGRPAVNHNPWKVKKAPGPAIAKDDVDQQEQPMTNLNIIQAMEDFSKMSDQEEFSLTDRNKDGQLTLFELHKAIRAYDPAGIDFTNDGVIEWFKDLDTDKNGKVTMFEYLLTIKRLAKQQNQKRNMVSMRFRRYFDEADTDGNQKLSFAEATAFARKYRFPEKKILEAFNTSDKNRDRQLQFDEFIISFPVL